MLITKIGDSDRRMTGKTTTIAKLIVGDLLNGKTVGAATPNFEMYKNLKDKINQIHPGIDLKKENFRYIKSSTDLVGTSYDSIYIDEASFLRDENLFGDIRWLHDNRGVSVAYS